MCFCLNTLNGSTAPPSLLCSVNPHIYLALGSCIGPLLLMVCSGSMSPPMSWSIDSADALLCELKKIPAHCQPVYDSESHCKTSNYLVVHVFAVSSSQYGTTEHEGQVREGKGCVLGSNRRNSWRLRENMVRQALIST